LGATTYTDNVTVWNADTANDVNRVVYTILNDPADMDALKSTMAVSSKGHLFGGTMSNGTDTTNDIDVTAGECIDSTGAARITWSALTKQLDASFSAGTGAGGRDTGAIANNTWHVFAIKKDSDGTGDILFSLSATAPTMPSGYTYFRRIGSIRRVSAAITGFVQDGDYFRRKASIIDVDTTNPGTSAVTSALSVPGGINVTAIVNVYAIDSTPGGFLGLVSDLAADDEAPTSAGAPLANFIGSAGGGAGATQIYVRTDTSQQIRYRLSSSTANTLIKIVTVGWIDRRGRDA
jgi:hypothetical protein